MSEQITISLGDGGKRQFDKGITCDEVAGAISKSLRRNSLVALVDDDLVDLSYRLDKDCGLRLVTRDTDEGREVLRHDCAHIMAEAVQGLFPGTQVTFGPAIDNGFYYDFHSEHRFSPEDFPKIEKKMREIVARNSAFEREEWTRDEARKHFSKQGEDFKVEHVDVIPKGEALSVYRQGDWLDLCRGPHSRSTGAIGAAFKLLSVSGSYWRGDTSGPQLQRIYGTCWESDDKLKAYLNMLEEAQRRDHRKLGREMDLFHMSQAATGSIFWHDKGWTIFRELENYLRRRYPEYGYVEVRTPQLVDRTLWEKSGHWEKFVHEMFVIPDKHDEDRMMAFKPMNCPCHVMIFKQDNMSYRDLPLRMAEFGSCLRDEPSGALHGIMRLRSFTQDDAHVFCTEDQIVSETKAFFSRLKRVYRDLGFTDYKVMFSSRPEVRAGSDEVWDKAEKSLLDATRSLGEDPDMNPGEGAFYGPKLEFILSDAIGREWQCGTLQVDFVLPERLDAHYVDAQGNKRRPVMLHQAILGSIERFIGITLEHYAGHLPLWLSPRQVAVLPISDAMNEYAQQVCEALKAKDIRAVVDNRSQTLQYKIRDNSTSKVPQLWVVGEREAKEKTVSIRRLGEQKQETLALGEAIEKIAQDALAPDQRAPAPQLKTQAS